MPSPPPPTPLQALLLLLTITTSKVTGILHPVDFLALQDLHRSLSDLPGSHFLSSWDFTSDPCDFPGVSCSADRVISLSLGDPRAGSPGLSGHLPPSLGHLSSLLCLSLLPGHVSGPLPSSLSLLPSLRFLAAPRNRLSGRLPPYLSPSLHTLDLSSNLLSGHIPHSISSLPFLSNLLLGHNHLSGHIPSFNSRYLRHLDLKANAFHGRLPRKLPTSLTYLSLSFNRFSGPMGPPISHLRHLTYLDLSRNFFSGEIPGVVFSFPLTSLQLQRNRLSGMVRPERKVAIGVVDLSHNRLTGMVSPLLAGVRRLYLNDNEFAGEVPKGLLEGLDGERKGAIMEVLYLQRNYLTGVEMGPEVEIPASSSFCVQYNCMVPPPAQEKACPVRAGRRRERPRGECRSPKRKEMGR